MRRGGRRGVAGRLAPGLLVSLASLAWLSAIPGGLAGCGGASPEPDAAVPRPDGSPAPAGEVLGMPVDLYFPTRAGRLAAETRELPPAGKPVDRIRSVVEAVLTGPRSADGGLVRPLPEDVALEGVYLGPNGVAFLDLATPEPREPPAVGSREEMQIVYSLVNSVTLNVAEARRVVLLWNGSQRGTFAGHLDTSHPLAPNTGLVSR